MKRNTKQEQINKEKLQALISNGLNHYSLSEKTDIIDKWSENKDKTSPVSFLGMDLYFNYLQYLLINAIDRYIGNEKPFIPNQFYQQEASRLFQLEVSDTRYETGKGTGDFRFLNFRAYFYLERINHSIGMPSMYDPKHDYSREYNREFRNRDNVCLSDSYLKKLMDSKTYCNFLFYKKLYRIDERIDNRRPFIPTQDYHQEYTRQTKFWLLEQSLRENETFALFFEKVNCAMEAVIYEERHGEPWKEEEVISSHS